MPEPDCFLRYRINAATRNFITSGKSHVHTYWPPVAAATRGFKMVLFTASQRNNFVGGTPYMHSTSALLVLVDVSNILEFLGIQVQLEGHSVERMYLQQSCSHGSR